MKGPYHTRRQLQRRLHTGYWDCNSHSSTPADHSELSEKLAQAKLRIAHDSLGLQSVNDDMRSIADGFFGLELALELRQRADKEPMVGISM
jgi:hypothetical protein